MTLILGMSKPEGIYLSADFRVTLNGHLVDDASVKLLDVQFPPIGGTRALIAYTGLAELPDGTSMGTWLVETIRGESEFPDQAMAHLLSRLNRDVAPCRKLLILNVLLIEGAHGTRRLFGGLTNVRGLGTSGGTKVMREFEYQMSEVSGVFAFASGSGAAKVVADGHFDLVRRQLEVRPRRALDHMKLLATINRQVAASVKTVSPACHVAFVPAERPESGPPDRLFGPTSRSFTERGEAAPVVMPFLIFGIDTSNAVRHTNEMLAAVQQGIDQPPGLDTDALNAMVRRRR